MSSNQERARELFSRGLEAHLARSWEEAERLYREALALAPARPSLVFNLGRLMLDRERDAEAERLFDRVLQAAPDDQEARYNLGVSLARQGRYEEALSSFDRAIALRPGFADAHSGRGLALDALGRHEAALEAHARSIELEPGRGEFQESFCRAARAFDERRLPGEALERAVLACLAGRNVDYQSLGRVAWRTLRGKLGRSGLDPAAHAVDFRRMQQLHPRALRELCGDRLLLAALEKITIGDRATESLFTGIREALLQLAASGGAAPALLEAVAPLALALAQQCFLNEYVWDVTEAEQALAGKVERGVERAIETGAPAVVDVAMVACYGPLAGKPKIAGWCRARPECAGTALAGLVRSQLAEPAIEAAIASELREIGGIRDSTSLTVKAQYEESPYPRWLNVARAEPMPYTARILREIAPFKPPLAPATEAPRILIAGCGTGRHAIAYATGYLGSRVTAIDLSGASLAYAHRKADELGVTNIEFVRADILGLDALEAEFDVISSIGVLHHMAEPATGLRRLTERLAPGGYLMLGLYSELARADIVELRSIIARAGFPPSVEGIRACRRFVGRYPGDRFRALVDEAADFYSTSMVRDLLFHVMEHRFTIPRIADLLAQNGLRFIGFTFQDPAAKNLYRKAYAGDADMLDLRNWGELETAHPRIFRGMYQFWASKVDPAPA